MEDKKKRGRPVKENKKIYMMNIRLTDDEKAELMDFAHKNSTTMTGVVRCCFEGIGSFDGGREKQERW